MSSEQWMEVVKFFGVLATALAAFLGGAKAFTEMQKAKSSLNPQLEHSMVSNIERDSHARREHMELMTRVLEKLSDNSIRMNENHQAGQHKTEELHNWTRREIAGLGDKLGGDLKTIQDNQVRVIELVSPITERFKRDLT